MEDFFQLAPCEARTPAHRAPARRLHRHHQNLLYRPLSVTVNVLLAAVNVLLTPVLAAVNVVLTAVPAPRQIPAPDHSASPRHIDTSRRPRFLRPPCPPAPSPSPSSPSRCPAPTDQSSPPQSGRVPLYIQRHFSLASPHTSQCTRPPSRPSALKLIAVPPARPPRLPPAIPGDGALQLPPLSFTYNNAVGFHASQSWFPAACSPA
ncbi:hypothetical protein DFH06DRAFT_1424799 [Mycena polygramma]|nr:hypothetical protein DFH06DRAFT_1424799 [Mycena polygramma]